MPSFYDSWKEAQYECPECSWKGSGAELEQGDMTGEYFDVHCPKCGERRTSIFFPTFEPSRANWNRVTESDKLVVEMAEERQRQEWLTEIAQLPDIPDPVFTLTWECEASGTSDTKLFLKLGEEVIFQEPGIYEGFRRFVEVAEILKAKYGAALQDLIPTLDSSYMLYGDVGIGFKIVNDARDQFRGTAVLPLEGDAK